MKTWVLLSILVSGLSQSAFAGGTLQVTEAYEQRGTGAIVFRVVVVGKSPAAEPANPFNSRATALGLEGAGWYHYLPSEAVAHRMTESQDWSILRSGEDFSLSLVSPHRRVRVRGKHKRRIVGKSVPESVEVSCADTGAPFEANEKTASRFNEQLLAGRLFEKPIYVGACDHGYAALVINSFH